MIANQKICTTEKITPKNYPSPLQKKKKKERRKDMKTKVKIKKYDDYSFLQKPRLY